MKIRIALGFIAAAGLIQLSCHHTLVAPSTPEVSYSKDIQPLLTGNCTSSGCHGETDTRRMRLMTYQDLTDHHLITAGKPLQSELYQVITRRTTPMPPDRNMSSDAILQIETWILQGAKNN